MAKELCHFVFSNPKQILRFFLPLFIGMLGIPYGVLFILNPNSAWKLVTMHPWVFIVGIPGLILSLALLLTLNEKLKGADIPVDEFILYDNGWFVFWSMETRTEGWTAPAKLDWVLPPAKKKKDLIKELGYVPNGWYVFRFDLGYLYVKKRRKNKYFVFLALPWIYPSEKWKNWVFYGVAGGWLNEKEYKRLVEFTEFIKKKAEENLKNGITKIPAKNVKQEHIDYYKRPWYWNEVFQKENIRELYKKETGEDIPEPVRSFLFDYEKFKKVYLKNKRETGDWFGRKNKEKVYGGAQTQY